MSISKEDTARIYAALNAEKGCSIENIEKLYNDAIKMIDARAAAALDEMVKRRDIC